MLFYMQAYPSNMYLLLGYYLVSIYSFKNESIDKNLRYLSFVWFLEFSCMINPTFARIHTNTDSSVPMHTALFTH